jgi:ATP-dependent DNA ligase
VGAGWSYEPKWDGFRCLAFREAGADGRGAFVDLRSRNDRPLARYFPELVAALTALPGDDVVLDGEILVRVGERFDFGAILLRLHPAASRVARLAVETPAVLVVFDVLAIGETDLRAAPYAERRSALEAVMAAAPPPLLLTPATAAVEQAQAWLDHGGDAIDGVVAKEATSTYQAGRRAMVKVKRRRTADCVVAGFRWLGGEPIVSSLLLGLYDAGGDLHHVGVVSAFARRQRVALVEALRPYAVALAGHPWEHGFGLEGGALGRLRGTAGRWTPELGLDWQPLAPLLVAEVAFDAVDGIRFRHPARFARWRPDKPAAECQLDQLDPLDAPAPTPPAPAPPSAGG